MLWLLCLTVLAIVISMALPMTLLQRLRRMRIQPIEYRLRKVQDLPAVLAPLFEDPIQALEQQGFQHVGLLEVQPLTYQPRSGEPGGVPHRDWEMLLFHPEQNTYAHIGLRYPMEPRLWYQVAFYNFFEDRSLLLTLNGEAHQLIGSMPHTTVKDFYQPTLELQWQGHCQALQDKTQSGQNDIVKTDAAKTDVAKTDVPQAYTEKTVVKVPPVVYADVLNAHYCDYLQALWDSEAIAPADSPQGQPQLHYLQWKARVKTAWNMLRKRPQMIKLNQKIARAQQSPIEIPLEVEVASFERMRWLETGHLSTQENHGFGGWLFWGSLGLFLLSFWTAFDSLGLVMFAGAIALHEGGHHWAMNHQGYRETSILFLPFVGGAATGQKPEAQLQEKIWVLLAGPMPGLLLGLGLLGVSSTAIQQFAAILIGLNLFNLLPLYPLDGGQIAQLLLLSCHPWMETGMRMVAIATLILFSFWAAWTVPTLGMIMAGIAGAIALLISLGLPNSIRLAGLQAQLLQDKEQPLSVQTIFVRLKTIGGDRWSFAERYGLAEELWARCQDARTTRRSRCGLTLMYLACLLLPLMGLCQGLSGTASLCQDMLANRPRWESL